MHNVKNAGRKKTKSGDVSVKYSQPFAKRLRDLMELKKCTQQQISDFVGVSRQSVGSWCSGETAPDIVTAGKVADYFRVSTDYLLGRSKSPTINENLAVAEKTTGLTAQSIKALKSISKYNAKTLNEVITSKHFSEIVLNISNGIKYSSYRTDFISQHIKHALGENIPDLPPIDPLKVYEFQTEEAAINLFNSVFLNFVKEGI